MLRTLFGAFELEAGRSMGEESNAIRQDVASSTGVEARPVGPKGADVPPARRTATLIVVSAAAFLATLDLFIVNIAFPEISRTFGNADLGAMSWILNGYTVVFAAFLNPAGRLGDRYGHRGIFLSGLAVFTVASGACGLSGSFVVLVSCRVVQAIGAAMLMPSSLALLLAVVPGSRRAAAVSTWSAVGAVAAVLGPPVGGLLVELSWRWIFFVNVPLGVLVLAVGPFVLARGASNGVGLPDLFGALCIVLGVGALVWALIELSVAGSSTTVVAVAAICALVAISAAIWRSARHPVPAVDLVAAGVLPVWSSCLALLLFSAAFGAMLLGTVILLSTIWGLDPAAAGVRLSPGPAVVVLVSLTLTGRLVGKFGVGIVAAAGALLYVLGVVIWLCRIGPQSAYASDFLPGALFTGAGIGLVLPSLSAVAGLVLPAHQWGAGSALINTARQLGIVIGTTVLTMICHPTIDLAAIRRGWEFAAGAAGAAGLIAAALAVSGRLRPVTGDERGSSRRPMNRLLGRIARTWIALVIAAVTATGGVIIYRLHGVFGSQHSASGEMRTENIVSTIPKYVTYEVDGPADASGMISYVDERSQPQQVRFSSLPWSHTLVTTLPSVFANVIAQSDHPELRCTITVNGVLREQQNGAGADATAFCLVKAA